MKKVLLAAALVALALIAVSPLLQAGCRGTHSPPAAELK
jgi:hypothetical protein